MRMCQTGTNLLKIPKSFVNRERSSAASGSHIPARHELKHDVVKCRARKVDCRSMTESADDIRMPDSVQRYRFVLKIGNKCSFEFRVRLSLEIDVQCFDNNSFGIAFACGQIFGNIDLRITSTTKTFLNVIAAI